MKQLNFKMKDKDLIFCIKEVINEMEKHKDKKSIFFLSLKKRLRNIGKIVFICWLEKKDKLLFKELIKSII